MLYRGYIRWCIKYKQTPDQRKYWSFFPLYSRDFLGFVSFFKPCKICKWIIVCKSQGKTRSSRSREIDFVCWIVKFFVFVFNFHLIVNCYLLFFSFYSFLFHSKKRQTFLFFNHTISFPQPSKKVLLFFLLRLKHFHATHTLTQLFSLTRSWNKLLEHFLHLFCRRK